MKNKRTHIKILLLQSFILISCVLTLRSELIQANSASVGNSNLQKLYQRNALEKEGFQLVKRGQYGEALAKYQKALEPKYRDFEWEMGTARAAIVRIYTIQGEYEKALDFLKWHLDHNPQKYDLWYRELKALENFQKSGDPVSVRSHINNIYSEKSRALPPNQIASTYITKLLRLYNLISEHETGIDLIDKALEWAYENEKALVPLKDHRIKTAAEAVKCAAKDKPVEERDPNWRGCSWLAEYLTIREAFEQDKAEGFKGCAGFKHDPANPNNVCMGRATKALIQSDYFPW